MYRTVFYSKSMKRNIPLMPFFITCWPMLKGSNTSMLKLCFIYIFLLLPLSSCGVIPVKWHSIEQTPSESVAFVRGGVFVSGEYLRSATIAEIDNVAVVQANNESIEIDLGQHHVKIYCGEAQGEFNSLDLEGKAETLVLDAQLQRTYLVRCEPYSHWWIEDSESKAVVAGEKFTNKK